MIQSVSGITKKNSTWPNFSGFSAIIPIPAAPIPCYAFPVPIRPPAIAIAAAIANIGFAKSEPPDELSPAANAEGETNNKSAKITPKDMLRKENFLLNDMHLITLFYNIKTC